MIETLFFKRRSPSYNCTDFAIDAAKELLCIDIQKALQTLNDPELKNRVPNFTSLHQFKKVLYVPNSGIILFKRKPAASHVGILWQGKVLHLGRHAVQWVELDLILPEFSSYSCFIVRSL
jgi:hypothetical protein